MIYIEDYVSGHEEDDEEINGDLRLIDELLKGEYKTRFGVRISKIQTKEVVIGIGFYHFGKERSIEFSLLKWKIAIGKLMYWEPNID